MVFISATFISSLLRRCPPPRLEDSSSVQLRTNLQSPAVYIVFPSFGKGPISSLPLPARPSLPPPFRFAGLERSRSVSDSLSSEEGEGGGQNWRWSHSPPPRPTQATRCRGRREEGEISSWRRFPRGHCCSNPKIVPFEYREKIAPAETFGRTKRREIVEKPSHGDRGRKRMRRSITEKCARS